MKEKDYVIAQLNSGRPFLGLVDSIKNDYYTIIPDELRYRELRKVDVYKRDILIRLGRDPKPGKVYGVDVSNVYRKSINHDAWGPIHFFTKPDKEVLQRLRLGLDYTAKKLDKAGLLGFTDCFQTEIRVKKGKYAGVYQHKKDNQSLVWYAPECADTQENMNYVIFHEYGHVLRFNGLHRSKARARWQRLFLESIAPVVVSKKVLTSLLDHLIDTADSTELGLGQVLKEYTAEDESLIVSIKALLRWIKQIHHVSPKDLQVLWDAADVNTIKSLWPTSSIDTSELSPVVTEYATKNVEELFAESFALYMNGVKLPKHVTSLLEKSLSEIKKAS